MVDLMGQKNDRRNFSIKTNIILSFIPENHLKNRLGFKIWYRSSVGKLLPAVPSKTNSRSATDIIELHVESIKSWIVAVTKLPAKFSPTSTTSWLTHCLLRLNMKDILNLYSMHWFHVNSHWTLGEIDIPLKACIV